MVDKTAVAQQFLEAVPYAHALGLTVDDIRGGVAIMSLPWSEHIVGDPENGGRLRYLLRAAPPALTATMTCALITCVRTVRQPRRVIVGRNVAFCGRGHG